MIDLFTLIPAYSAQYLLAPTAFKLKPSVVLLRINQIKITAIIANRKPKFAVVLFPKIAPKIPLLSVLSVAIGADFTAIDGSMIKRGIKS